MTRALLQHPDSYSSLWTIEEVAAFLRVPVQTLYRWRKIKYGPKAARVGRKLRYDSDDVRAWFKAQVV
jgi:excisionase family DNA binding protein